MRSLSARSCCLADLTQTASETDRQTERQWEEMQLPPYKYRTVRNATAARRSLHEAPGRAGSAIIRMAL